MFPSADMYTTMETDQPSRSIVTSSALSVSASGITRASGVTHASGITRASGDVSVFPSPSMYATAGLDRPVLGGGGVGVGVCVSSDGNNMFPSGNMITSSGVITSLRARNCGTEHVGLSSLVCGNEREGEIGGREGEGSGGREGEGGLKGRREAGRGKRRRRRRRENSPAVNSTPEHTGIVFYTCTLSCIV